MAEIVSSNLILRNGQITFDYRKPFDILAESNPTNENPPPVSGARDSQTNIWLGN
jgi:hypothetical protein